MGTAMVVCHLDRRLLFAAGVKLKHLAVIIAVLAFLGIVFALAEPYRQARLTCSCTRGPTRAGPATRRSSR